MFCDDSSKQIVKMLVDECEAAGVRIETGCSVENVQHTDGGFRLRTTRGTLSAPALVVAYGIRGTVRTDLSKDPLGTGSDGKPV